MTQGKAAKRIAKSPAGKGTKVFTAEERAAMKQRAKELKAAATEAEDKQAVLDTIAAMTPADRALAKRLHAVVTASAPALAPKLWYGMPAYYRDGKLICFFQDSRKFKTRYTTFGFSDNAKLDEGKMWPSSYALTELTAAEEARIAALVKKAVS